MASTAKLDPEITAADHEMDTTGVIDARAVSFFESRGPAQFLSRVKVPTLILQGTVDDLFTLDEGIANYEALRSQGTTVSMAWFCGGHGVCLTDPGSAIEVGPLSLAWMQRYVARDTSVQVLKGFAFVDQNGTSYAAPGYPLPPGAPIVATGSGRLALKAGGGSGPPTVAANAQAANVVDVVAYPVTPGPAANALNITVPIARAAVVVGAPKLSMTYSGTVVPGTRPTRVFAQLVDPATGIVVNNQITPDPGHARRQIPHPHGPTRDRRLHREGRYFARAAVGGHDRRVHHPATWWDDQLLAGHSGPADREGPQRPPAGLNAHPVGSAQHGVTSRAQGPASPPRTGRHPMSTRRTVPTGKTSVPYGRKMSNRRLDVCLILRVVLRRSERVTRHARREVVTAEFEDDSRRLPGGGVRSHAGQEVTDGEPPVCPHESGGAGRLRQGGEVHARLHAQ